MEVNDHSHLGGSMGTEYTTHILSRYFEHKSSAYDAAWKYAKKHCPHVFENNGYNKPFPKTLIEWRKLSYKIRNGLIADMSNRGIRIMKCSIE